jgi:hypothetical protein
VDLAKAFSIFVSCFGHIWGKEKWRVCHGHGQTDFSIEMLLISLLASFCVILCVAA